ncbi:RHS repeat-associated core domain-containing protein [Candidatus Cardinium sp. TP]|uniref:RHS repeat-associated core domain-containing protein n=1 Tax=Candidatus Cardinium sp. TP TaxID=2961955 RepID=UPI0021AF599D|nr:RHS repeat-associated core domain-containing protein [Candidatus Cardinium sp. TP]MCT4697243.1 RHS repeat-associated core domain-containing protein [Candidatus Cardinium sp. TP]
MNRFTLSTQKLSNANRERIEDISSIRLNSDSIIVCIRQGRQLIGYKYVSSTQAWHYDWSEPVFGQEGNYPLDRYPWLVADKLIPNENIVLLRHPNGIQFYQLDPVKPGLKLLGEDIKFNEFFSGDLLWGHFYANTSYVGVMTRDVNRKIKFYASTLRYNKPPLSTLKINVSFPIWSAAETDFFITKLHHNDPATIGLRTTNGLEFYQFNADYLLEKVISTGKVTKSALGRPAQDHLFFGDLTHQIYQDILHLNNSGLYTYQYNNSQKDYTFLHRHTGFTQPYGWEPHYSNSVRLFDINNDARDDLLFTGPQGITALSFDSTTNSWKILLDPEQLSGAQRYATVVGTLPPVPPAIVQPSIFTQDTEGNIEWAKVIPVPVPPLTTTVPPISTTSASTTAHPSSYRNVLVPQQIIRTHLPEKPTLRWVEQWDDSFLKEAVDPASGQVRMHVPLIDIFALTGWRLQLGLFYNSAAVVSDLLGIGWSLPLAQDYIFVDYQGSICPEDARYYLIAQGRPQRLKFIADERGVQRFQLAEAAEGVQVTISYRQSAQCWMIEGTAEQTTYGKANHNAAQDALQWSLAWPNWRGIGRDKAQQQPLITAWYLNMRLDKDTQRTLYYHYEKDIATIADGKTYDAALRLKTISDSQYMRLNLDYAPKERSEYTAPNPVDKEGNIIFPTPLAQSHYLQGYSLTTAAYSQALKFVYQVNNDKRLLTAIQQQLLSHTESVLQFSYQTVLDKQVLESCSLQPKGSILHFNYQHLNLPAPTIVHNYPTREKAKVAYGSDYAVMAYRDLNPTAGKVILRIMNRAMNQTIIDCSVNTELSCPSAESEIKDYVVQAYQNSFIVFIESDQKRALYIYNRHKQTWSTDPTIYRFGKQALIRFSETFIAAAEPDENNLMLFKRLDNQSDWNEQTLTLSRPITALALHNRLTVGYDNHELWLFRYDVQTGWKKQFIDFKSNSISQILELFDLETEARQQIVTALKQNSLQILNNFVLFNTLQENNGLLSSHIQLFLLDSQYNIAKKQSFNIARENIYQISHESKSQDGNIVYHLGYIKEEGLFRVRVKNVSGKVIEDIKNRNLKEDQIEELKKQANQDSQNSYFKKSFFLDLHLYTAQISQQGAYIGNDTLLRITGTGWEKESLPTVQTTPLGKHFILEPANDDKSLFKLYKQGSNQNKQDQPLRELSLHAPGQIINQYPAYIAYHPKPNLVKVLTFKDEQTLGQLYIFDNEQLLPGSDLQNLITVANASPTTMVHAEPQECRVRAVSTLLPPKEQSFVNRVTLTASDTQRITAYERSFNAEQESLTYSETVTIIPGDNKTAYGWHEATRSYHRGNVTETERWFNANGRQVLGPPEEASTEQSTNTTVSVPNPMLLLDRSGKWLISDCSPYSLADEMVAYYGFEPYENNQIGAPVANTTAKTWRTSQAQIIKGKFSFTGEHYLQLKSTTTDHPSFLEGLFQPRDQETTYLAACWIRCSTALALHTAVPYLKAIIHTSNGQKIIGLQAQVKHQLGDWSYLELPLNFQVFRQVYRDYVNYNATTASNSVLPSPEDASFQITLRVESPAGQIVDLDHIRFTPLTHDFQAAIYHPLIGRPTAIIQANGLVTRTIYNRLQQEIASIDEEGQLQQFSTSSRTGKLVPAPQGSMIDAKPNAITFEPAYGSYENFDTSAWHNRWQLDHPAAWQVALGQLWHKQSGKHRMEARVHLFDGKSAAIRCYFALQESPSALSLNWKGMGNLKFTRQSDHATNVDLPNGQSITPLPSAGELIVMLEQNYLWLWLDGVLLVDQALPISRALSPDSLTPWSSFALEAEGKVLVEDCLIMNRPQVTVKYYNAFSEKTQVIQLEDARTAQVNELLYDALGREAITTKTTRVKRNAGQSLLAYRPDFVSNKNPAYPQSIWNTGILQGAVNRLNPADQGVAYTRTEYAPNPLDQEKSLGLPGPYFSITGRYATKISQHSDLAFLDNLFPTNQGYRQKVEHTPSGSLRIAVFDQSNNQVANYVRVPSYNHLLSTYEYDRENRLIKILPPLYHEKVDTASRLTAWQFGEDRLSPKEKQWQEALATRFVYDRYGHLIRKITPDSGTTEYLYNAAGQKRFMVSLDATNQSQRIVYFNYDGNNQLMSTGHISRPLSLTALRGHLESRYLPYAQEYQKFDYANGHFDPLLRGRMKQYITHNDGQVIVEKLRFDAQQQVIYKKAILEQTESDPLTHVEKQYVHGKLQKLIYPITIDDQPLHVVHSYNRLGQLVGLGTSNNPTHYASFTYHATGQLASEHYQPNMPHSFIRNYKYNSPGFLEQISDPFLSEDIAYTNKGYGQAGYGDGMVMQATFNASWPVNADGRWFQVRENDLGGNYSAVCVKALKRTGYLTDSGQPIKLYIRDAETALPLVCGGETGRHMAKLVAEKQKPTYYGHRYAYGNHQELIKAKYFTDETENVANPLQPDSFAKEIPGLTKQQSQHIWQLLTNAGYIIRDQQRNDLSAAVGKRGESFFRNTELYADLAALKDDYTLYVEPIERLIISAISQQRRLSLADFEAAFLHWQNLDITSTRLIYNWQKKIASQIGQMLLDKGYLPTQRINFARPLNSNFTTTLHQYTAFIPKIVQTLSRHFTYALGQTAFDVESYKIDANGNHHLFYTGFDRYELAYYNGTNKIQNVKSNWPIELERKQVLAIKHDGQGNAIWSTQLKLDKFFSINHDYHGNIIQSLHKNIKHIEYHPVSQRTTRIHLTDDRTLHFYYDAQGERVLKRVFDAEGKISHENHYLRDEKGRVLIDRQTKYLDGSTQKIITTYLYGPRGLLGFIRNNNFYSVTTDHAGSVRLVIKEGIVVAAYDYLPYGGLMRSYGNDPQAHIMYRYTGQEWDEETGLYNYHARFYDPSIGRFYQPDPKAQYFSPYKYAGNSPVSVVDPDGEFAFLLTFTILGAIGSAWLGGAAANNRLNPVDWDFKDPGTWLGIVGGGITGGLLPIGAAASVAAIGIRGTLVLTAGVAYLNTAASQGLDPSQWKWDRLDTWNSLFQGASTGAGIAGGIAIVHNFANTGKAIIFLGNFKALKAIGIGQRAVKGIFLTVSYTGASSVAYLRSGATNNGNFAFWEWDWTNPATWSALVDGFDIGMGWPQNIMEMGRGAGRLTKNPKKYLFSGQNNLKLKAILKDSKHPLYKTTTSVVMAYYMGSAANRDFDITKWNLAVFSTYEGVLNGVFLGKDITKTLKYIRSSKAKQPSNTLVQLPQKQGTNWSRKVSRMLDFMQVSRIAGKYQNLVEQAFSASTLWVSKLGDQSPSVRNQVENFFKEGLGKWKSGENRPPQEFQRLILDEIKLKIQEDSGLTKWREEVTEVSKKQQEIFLDREVEFLTCTKGSKRRKRSSGSSSCFVPTDNEHLENQAKRELVEQFLDSDDLETLQVDRFVPIGPPVDKDSHLFDPSSPKGFAENLSLFLAKTPNVLASTKPDFFPNLILGSILTLPTTVSKKDVYAKIAKVKCSIPNTAGEYDSDKTSTAGILKICFKDGQNLILKTFVIEPKSYKDKNGKLERIPDGAFESVKNQLDLNSRYNNAELDEILSELKLKNPAKIKEYIFYINKDRLLSVKKLQENDEARYQERVSETIKNFAQSLASKNSGTPRKHKNQLESYLLSLGLEEVAKRVSGSKPELSDADLDTIRNKIRPTINQHNFKKIESENERRGLDKSLNKIFNNKIDEVKAGIEKFSNELLKIYNENAKKFGFDLESESGFHGFFYGALSLNFKYRYNLDVYVERIAGRGYADLILLSRNGPDGNKNWRAVPIIIELKADRTSSGGATDQTTGTGYLYNLSMRTIAEKAIVVGINSNLEPGIKASEAIDIKTEDIPRSKGFIQQLIAEKDNNNIKSELEPELKHLYYSISPLAIKGNDHYLSHLILGEILSKKGREIYVRRNGELSTFVFKEEDKWIMLNLVESSKRINNDKYKFEDVNIDDKAKLPTLEGGHKITNLIRVDIKVNPKSKDGWDPNKQKRKTSQNSNAGEFYFQSIEVKNGGANLERVQYQKLSSIDMMEFFTNTEKIIGSLSESLKSIKDTINSESDFQAVLQGLFVDLAKKVSKEKKGTIIKVFPEANLSKDGRSDLIISILQERPGQQVHEEGIILMELKYSKGDGEIDLKEGNLQVKKYGSNLKSVTDLFAFTPIVAVFCKTCKTDTGTIKFKVHDVQNIHHTSAKLSPVANDGIDNIPDLDLSAAAIEGIDTLTLGKKRKGSEQPESQPAGGKNRLGGRRKRSLDYVENYQNKLTKNIQSESKLLVDNSLPYVTSITELIIPDKENLEKLDFSSNNFGVASSGSSKLQSWPISLVKKVGATVSSFLATRLIPDLTDEVNNQHTPPHYAQPELLLDQKASYEEAKTNSIIDNKFTTSHYAQPEFLIYQSSSSRPITTGPTVLEMVDKWLNNTDMDGLITCGTLLARKWTGYRPKAGKAPSYDPAIDKKGINILSSIKALESVYGSTDRAEEYDQAYEIDPSTIPGNAKPDTQAIDAVRKELAKEELATILAEVSEESPKFKKQLLQQEVQPKEQKVLADATQKADISLLKQEMCSIKPGQLAGTTLDMSNIYNINDSLVQNSIDHDNPYRKCGNF